MDQSILNYGENARNFSLFFGINYMHYTITEEHCSRYLKL